MADNSGKSPGYYPSSGLPPSEAWLFAQVILGKPVPEIISPQRAAQGKRQELEHQARFSEKHSQELRLLEAADAKARHDREVLVWAARISPQAEQTLRALNRQEAEVCESWQRAEQFADRLREAGFDANQPRDKQGQWTSTGRGEGGLLGNVIRRNQTIGDLTGVVTPGMIASSRLAATLQAAARLPGDVATAAAAGLVTGAKAVVNGSATAVKNVATLGLSSSQLELIGVTKEDRARGYDTAVSIATASGQVLIAVGTSGLATALSKGGTIVRTASGALVAFDAAGNAVGTVQGAYDASQNGVNLENGLQIAGGALGLSANTKAARELSRAAAAAQLEKVESYVARCPRKPSRTGTAADQFEIAHTGPHNYTISGGGKTFDIDGYRGTTILEAKHAGNLGSSPYISGTSCPDPVRAEILGKTRKDLEKAHVIIRSGETPFKSIEIITNTPASKALFEGMLQELKIPGTVRLAI